LQAHTFYNLVFNFELENQLKEALTELGSAQLIIKLLQRIYLKYTEIKSLIKNGDRNGMSNYRPTAVLTSFCKVLEKVMYEKL
jgi:hypothetical protein